MKNNEKIYGKYFSVICGILTVVSTFFPWVMYEGKGYTIYRFFLKTYEDGVMEKFAAANPGFYPTYGLTYFSFLAVIFCIVRMVLLFFNKKNKIVNNIMYFGQVIFFMGYIIFQGYESGIALVLVMIFIGIEFLVVMYLEQSYEINMKYRQMKKREREEKAERKRRLYFPGKYPKEFGRVIRENFVSKWKNYVLFIMTGVLSATFLTVAVGMNYMLNGVHSVEDMILGTGMQQILIRAMGLILFTTVFLTSFVFSYYIKSRVSDYKMFTVMGIRSKTLSLIMAAEYAGSLIAALVIGMIAGSGILIGIRYLLVRKFGEYTEIGGFSPQIYLFAFAGYVIILIFSTAINHESYLIIRDSFSGTEYVDKQKIPGKFLILWVLVGLDAMIGSITDYSEISIFGAVQFLFGVLLAVIMGKAFLMKWNDKSPRYYRHIFENIPFHYRFKKSSRYLILLTSIHFFVLGVYLIHLGSSLIALPEEKLFPYDFVLMAHEEDSDVLENIEKEYNAEITEYPMFRVTSPAGSAFGFMAFFTQYNPPGQYIGISESTYRELYKAQGLETPKPLELKEHEVHVVIQQDSSYKIRPLDVSTNVEEPNLKIGNPVSPSEYEKWKIKSHEVNILTGMLQRGAQENLVVFPDEYFESAYAGMEGEANRLCLIDVSKENYKAVDQKMRELRQRHIQDENYDYDIRVYYGREQMVNDIASERYTKEVLYTFVLLMLTACAWFLTYIKFSFDAEEMCQRYHFLDCMGMHEKEKMKTVSREMWPFARIPLIISVLGAIAFTVQLFRVRMYQPEQILSYIKTAGVIGVGYVVVQILWMNVMIYQMKKKMR